MGLIQSKNQDEKKVVWRYFGMIYDKTTGYSPLELIDIEKARATIKIFQEILSDFYGLKDLSLILVAGAGNGIESVLIQEELEIPTIGVDLNIDHSHLPVKNPNISFQKQDLSNLAFWDETFQVIYSYHVLEHVINASGVLQELARVMKPSSVMFIGFPNKNRLFSYIGTSQKATVSQKILWNLNDYWFRIQRKFENRFGAHAGFTKNEFHELSARHFSEVHSVGDLYMFKKYPKYRWLLENIVKIGFDEFLFPSNYFICLKRSIEQE